MNLVLLWHCCGLLLGSMSWFAVSPVAAVCCLVCAVAE